MRALLISVGTAGDVLPLIAIGAELRRLGHEVAFAGAEPFGDHARRAGLEFESLMTAAEYRACFEHPDFWRPMKGAGLLFSAACDLMRPAYEFVARRNVPDETVVVASSLAIGGKVAHDKLRTPIVTVHLSPVMIQSRHEAPIIPGLKVPRWLPAGLKWALQMGSDQHFTTRLIGPRLNAFRKELGLPPAARVRHWWNSASHVLLMFPEWFCAPQPDWPKQARQIGFPSADRFGAPSDGLPSDLAAFLEAGAPPVVVSFSSARRRRGSIERKVVEACRRIGSRCLVLTDEPVEPEQSASQDVHFAPFAPLSLVLPKCAAVVHHGGVGTVATAFAAGTPQIVVPFAFDQFDNASRVERLGCGREMSHYGLTTGRLAKTLDALMRSPAVAQACGRVAGLSASGDAAAEAAQKIDRVFARLRQRRKRRLEEQRRHAVDPTDPAR